MSKDAVLRLKSSLLFKTLLDKEKKEGFENKLSSKIETIIEVVSDLLERIPENMPEFTLHDSNHSAKIVEIVAKFLPKSTLDYLNSIELSLIILSAYVHDIGMTASKEEKEVIIANNSEYKILFKTLVDKKDQYEHFLSINDHRAATFIEDQVFTEYLRKTHVIRSAEYIKKALTTNKMEVEINGIPFWKHLITICNGHGTSVKAIKNTNLYPNSTLVGEKIINVQFLTLLLRLGDILDLDPERTPKVIYEFANPQDPISILEWKKHRSIIGYSITPEKILFEAECAVPEVERALKQFMEWIEIERKQTMQLLHDYSLPSLINYKLELNEEISSERIQSDGSYIYNDLKFEINYQKVLDLLMGLRLYRSSVFSLRELIQNSNDAIKARQEIYAKKSENFDSKIVIELTDQTLMIKDNGIGMDAEIFKNYFLQIGKSYYSSPDFYARYDDIDVTSEFGIGVLSVFMIANSITIQSRREPDNPIHPPKPINFEIPTAYSYTVQKHSTKADIGTEISLKLKSENPFKTHTLKEILSRLIPYPKFPIYVLEKGSEFKYMGKDTKDIPTALYFNGISNIDEYKFDDLRYESAQRFSHKFHDINFSDSLNPILKNIEGTLSLVNSGQYNWYTLVSGSFCQRSFSIGTISDLPTFQIETTENTRKLFPNWLSYYSTLNLTKTACLSITPDRTDIVVDEKYENLKQLIEDHILRDLEIFFDDFINENSENEFHDFMDFLISIGFINIDLNQRSSALSVKACKFLNNYITFPILQSDKSVKRIKVVDFINNANIGLVNYNINNDQLKQMEQLLLTPDCVIINIHDMKYRAGWAHRIMPLLSCLLSNSPLHSRPYLILTSMLPCFPIEIIKFEGKFRRELEYNFCYNISHSFQDNKKILGIPRQSIESYMTLNTSHPLVIVLFNEDWNLKKEGSKMIQKIQELINKSIEDSVKRIGLADKFFILKAFDTYGDRTDYFQLTSGLLQKDIEFIPLLNDRIKELWAEYIKLGFVESDSTSFLVDKDDFPRYWYD
jgi:molecular chaperone HtpG